MTWRTAFFAQAQSDYGVFREFKSRSDIAMCHKLHYLQMAMEKLAKAFQSSRSGDPPPKIHTAIVRFLKISKGRPEIRRLLGYENNHNAFSSYIDSLLEVAEQIEQLAPIGHQERPNSEYPWSDNNGGAISPISYSFPEFSRQALVEFQKLADGLFRIFPHVNA